MELLRLILCAVLGYLLGNIQTGLIVGRLKNNVDLRNHGSGSSGATNALRTLGRQSALLTLLGDMLKGLLASGVGMIIAGWHGGLVGALFVVIGHIWPVFFGFHGGKGVATTIGAMAILLPWHTLGMVVVGVGILLLTKTVSLASICGAVVFLFSGIISAIVRQDWFLLVFTLLMTALVVFAHRGNIGRIVRGNENRISSDMFKKK